MKALVLLTIIALSQARFDQEQVPIDAIRKVQGGLLGISDTIAGAAISDLLAGADPCAKLRRGDQILSELGQGSDAVAAAIGIVAAEKNFNPFSTSQPSICGDPALPQNKLLRGVTPKIDPAVGGADVGNALSARTVLSPLQADGKSIADLLSENGFTNFTTAGAKGDNNSAQSTQGGASSAEGSGPKAAANETIPIAAESAKSAPPPPSASSPMAKAVGNDTAVRPNTPPSLPLRTKANQTLPSTAATTPAPADLPAACTCTCAAENTAAKGDPKAPATSTGKGMKEKGTAASAVLTTTSIATTTQKAKQSMTSKSFKAAATTTSQASDANKNAGDAVNGAEDFGSCDPTMSFKAGRPGRKATEFTFQSNDAAIEANQQDALNPNIITNRICDELTNICNANAAAKATCLSAKAQILALGTRDQSTADAWNALVAERVVRRGRRRA